MHICGLYLSHALHYRHVSSTVAVIIMVMYEDTEYTFTTFSLQAHTSIENTGYTLTT